jgi:hypothetical protein
MLRCLPPCPRSFPGEHRGRVEAIANLLAVHVTRNQVLYDRWHQSELNRLNLDVYLSNFFEIPWTRPAATLLAEAKSWVIGVAGHSLRAVGRLADAAEPQRIAAEADAKSEAWENAAINYNNLSELHHSRQRV